MSDRDLTAAELQQVQEYLRRVNLTGTVTLRADGDEVTVSVPEG